MLIYVLFNTHLQHPFWLNFSWIRSSSFMACRILFFLITTQLSPAIFGKNCLSYKAPNFISAHLCYTSKSLIAMMASVVVTSVAIVASVTNITLLYFLCGLSNDIIRTLKTPQMLVLKRRNQLTRSTSLFPLEKPLKSQIWKGALPYILSGSIVLLYPLLGERSNALCPF
jgi:hypothetical protein